MPIIVKLILSIGALLITDGFSKRMMGFQSCQSCRFLNSYKVLKSVNDFQNDSSSIDRKIQTSVSAVVAAALLFYNIKIASAEGIPGTLGCTVISNPSTTTVTCTRHGLDKDGRLFQCRSNENCVSSSSISMATKFSPPWSYATATTDAEIAFSELLSTLRNIKGANLVEIDTDRYYVRAEYPAKVPPGSVDDVEFILKPNDNLCLFRSATRSSMFVYPLQQPISDQKNNINRLEKIRNELGWASLGYNDDDYSGYD